MKTFDQTLKDERARLKMTQDEIAEFLGVSKRQYCEWESGRVVPMAIAQEGAVARLADSAGGMARELAAQDSESPNRDNG